MVGYSNTAGGNRAFLYANGQLMNLNGLLLSNPGWTLTEGYGINDAGQIAGSGLYHGQQHAFLLSVTSPLLPTTPSKEEAFSSNLPEPDSFILTGCGLCLASVLLRRRNAPPKDDTETDE